MFHRANFAWHPECRQVIAYGTITIPTNCKNYTNYKYMKRPTIKDVFHENSVLFHRVKKKEKKERVNSKRQPEALRHDRERTSYVRATATTTLPRSHVRGGSKYWNKRLRNAFPWPRAIPHFPSAIRRRYKPGEIEFCFLLPSFHSRHLRSRGETARRTRLERGHIV